MGFSPAQVREMSLWDFSAAADGYRKAHDPSAGKELSESEADALWELVQAEEETLSVASP